MDSVMRRRSIRKYTDKEVSDDIVKELLRAAMSAPSAGSEEPWHFVVIKNRDILDEITKHHPSSWMLKDAPLGIMVCCDLNLQKYPGSWVQDCAAATENILIEVEEKGLGGVWLGVYPNDPVVSALKNLFNLPENIVPFSVVALGYPAENKSTPDRYNAGRVHYDKW